jgi:hypothetical protein
LAVIRFAWQEHSFLFRRITSSGTLLPNSCIPEQIVYAELVEYSCRHEISEQNEPEEK